MMSAEVDNVARCRLVHVNYRDCCYFKEFCGGSKSNNITSMVMKTLAQGVDIKEQNPVGTHCMVQDVPCVY